MMGVVAGQDQGQGGGDTSDEGDLGGTPPAGNQTTPGTGLGDATGPGTTDASGSGAQSSPSSPSVPGNGNQTVVVNPGTITTAAALPTWVYWLIGLAIAGGVGAILWAVLHKPSSREHKRVAASAAEAEKRHKHKKKHHLAAARKRAREEAAENRRAK